MVHVMGILNDKYFSKNANKNKSEASHTNSNMQK